MATDDKKGYLLSAETARRVERAVRLVERRPRATPARGKYPSAAPSQGGKIATTYSGGIPAGSASGPGSGTVRMKLVTASGYQDTGVDVTACNSSAAAVGGNKVVQMKWIDGYWFIDVESC